MSCSLVLAVVTLGLVSAADLPAWRLPIDVIPSHYELKILTDLDAFTFSGEVIIDIKCKKATDKITLHAVSLKISEVTLTQKSDNNKVYVKDTALDTDNGFFIVSTAQPLVAGSSYLLHIPFSGTLNDDFVGYYKYKYLEKSSNTTKWFALTQFATTDARKAFPCFDEPEFKAKFSIHLGHRDHLRSVSNMPILKTTNDGSRAGWVWDEFKMSAPMSTYLVAFMISDFEVAKSDPQPNNVTFRVWARKDAIKQAEFVRENGPKFLSFYEGFFGIPYPLPKQDLVAIPDFDRGWMENWGLTTYGESDILLDESAAELSVRYDVSTIVASMVANQWFGNLVTMKWWKDVWLHKGFAKYASFLAVDHQFPDWNSYDYSISEDLYRVFYQDALQASDRISYPTYEGSDVGQIFNCATSSKVPLLMHMMSCVLGKKVFQSGVSKYLKKFAYKNADNEDFSAALSEEAEKASVLPSGVTVKQVMDMWTLQAGYPVLTVKRDGGKVTVSQKRFLSVPFKSAELEEQCWWVPISYSTAKSLNFNNTVSSHWLSCDLKELTFDTEAGPDDWIVLNNKVSGIYRVNYDRHTWTLLAEVLNGPNFAAIHELNRLQLVTDAMDLARVGDLDYKTAFEVLKYIRQETAYIPWTAGFHSLKHLKRLLWRTEKYPQFKALAHSLLAPLLESFDHFTTVPNGMEESRLKPQIIQWACSLEMDDCTRKATELFKLWQRSDTNPIPKELRFTVYCQGVKQGDAEWEFVLEKYKTSDVATEKEIYLQALGCSQQKKTLDRYLQSSIDSSSGISRQDIGYVFESVALRTHTGYNLALNFLESKIQQIYDYLAPNTDGLEYFLSLLSDYMVVPEEVEKFKKFLSDNDNLLKDSAGAVNQALETVEGNLVWMNKLYPTIFDSLSD